VGDEVRRELVSRLVRERDEAFTGPCGCDASVGVVCQSCHTYDVLAACGREIERLEAVIASQEAELVCYRATNLAQAAELVRNRDEIAAFHIAWRRDLQRPDESFGSYVARQLVRN
jgi:hypothetical protein